MRSKIYVVDSAPTTKKLDTLFKGFITFIKIDITFFTISTSE